MATEVFDHVFDAYNRPLHVGALVAYNYSGWVRRGVIQKITKAKSGYRRGRYIFFVSRLNENDQLINPNIAKWSKVTNINNLIRIGDMSYH